MWLRDEGRGEAQAAKRVGGHWADSGQVARAMWAASIPLRWANATKFSTVDDEVNVIQFTRPFCSALIAERGRESGRSVR